MCELCAAGTFAGTSGECEPCPSGSWSEEGSTTCSCNKGWTAAKTHTTRAFSDGKTICIKCPLNTFKAVRGRQECQACPFSFSSPEASEDLMECVPQTAWSAAASALSVMLKVCMCLCVCVRVPTRRRWQIKRSLKHMVKSISSEKLPDISVWVCVWVRACAEYRGPRGGCARAEMAPPIHRH